MKITPSNRSVRPLNCIYLRCTITPRLGAVSSSLSCMRLYSQKEPSDHSESSQRNYSHDQLWNLLSALFKPQADASQNMSKTFRNQNLWKLSQLDEDISDQYATIRRTSLFGTSDEKAKVEMPSIGSKTAIKPIIAEVPSLEEGFGSVVASVENDSNILYWSCGNLSVLKSDLERIMPSRSLRIFQQGGDSEEPSQIDFQLVRSRNPETLGKWLGYYLIFRNSAEARMYYNETLGAEISGIIVRMKFEDPLKPDIFPPILAKVPQIDREMCAIVRGLPRNYNSLRVIADVWDYDLIEDENLAVEGVRSKRNENGDSSWLLRFQNADEPRRLARQLDGQKWFKTGCTASVEILD